MLLYLKLAWRRRRDEGRVASFEDLREAIVEGAAQHIRPKLMTVLIMSSACCRSCGPPAPAPT